MIPEILFELCSRQKCGLQTDRRTDRQADRQVQSNIPALLRRGHNHADYKLNAAKILIFLHDRVENIVGKGENAGFQHFLLLLQCFTMFSKGIFLRVIKSEDCAVKI